MAVLKYPLLNETAANLIIEKIKSEFNAHLAEVDNQYKDGINMEPVKSESIYISDKFETLQPPGIFVLFGNMAFNYTKDQNYLDASNECVIVVSGEDVGADRLTKKMWRYARVIYSMFNLVDLNSTDGRLKITSIPKRLGYSDKVIQKMSDSKKKYRQDCVLELELRHFEKNLT